MPVTTTTPLTDAAYLAAKHAQGQDYASYVAAGKPAQQDGWRKIYDQVQLSATQKQLLSDFKREMKVFVVSGVWCGDCVRQGPMLQHIAEAAGAGAGGGGCIDMAWFDRDEHPDLQEKVRICGGNRVPVVIFAAEDFELVGYAGDKLLSRYRLAARQALGANCPLPGAPVPQEELDAEIQDWVDEFERVHLLLRLSGRLRQKHGD